MLKQFDVEPKPRNIVNLEIQIGYYALILLDPNLSEEWRMLYEERKQELESEL